MSMARYFCVKLGPDSIGVILFRRVAMCVLVMMIGYVVLMSVIFDVYGKPNGGIEV